MSVAVRHQEPHEGFASAFADARAALPGDIGDLREQRLARFAATGIPTQRVEAWKFTNVARHINRPMALAPRAEVGINDVSAYFCGGTAARRLIFVDGHVMAGLSHIRGLPPGLLISSLDSCLDDPQVAARIRALDDARSLTDLNTAMVRSGAVIDVAEGVDVGFPVQLVFLTSGGAHASMNHPRIILRLGKGARLHLIETHAAVGDGDTLTNLVSQAEIGAEAKLVHDRVQLGGEGTTLLSKADLELGGGAVLDQTLVTLGGALVRNESEVRLAGSHIDARMSGTFMPRGSEHVDNLIRMHHLEPDCRSDQFYKGALDGKGRGVFAGKIIVHEDAQRTNAYQTNNNLLLSDDAEIDTKPELEIYADDVKCSHGATCGDLDETALFYLRSRGIERPVAESIMTYAFAGEVVERLQDETARKLAKRRIFDRLPGGAVLAGMLE